MSAAAVEAPSGIAPGCLGFDSRSTYRVRMGDLPLELLPPTPVRRTARATKIVATIGPATDQRVGELLDAGMAVARLNFSHGSPEEHRLRAESIRRAARERMTSVAILADLPGPKMRLGRFDGGKLRLQEGELLEVREGAQVSAPGEVRIDVAGVIAALAPGHKVSLADGQANLVVLSVHGDMAHCRVTRAGEIADRKGVHLPDSPIRYELPTAEDRKWIELARTIGVDMLGISFVGHASELEEIRGLAPGIQLVAKIERKAALENLDAILGATDGVMVARGDLGVELEIEELPLRQKEILDRAVRAGRFTITATEMLESMIEQSRPTRAEVTDVANAVLDGTDAVMLSAETAKGKYPIEAVRTMARVARAAESSPRYPGRPRYAPSQELGHFSSATCMAAAHVSGQLDGARIVCFTETGNTVRLLSHLRPGVEIIGLSPNPATVRWMCVLAHVRPILFRREPTLEDMLETATELLLARRIVQRDDPIVFVAGVPPGVARSTNVVKLHRVGEEVALR
jgi:pyruvate kinase